MKRLILFAALILVLPASIFAQYAIIGHSDLPQNELTLDEVRDIFSGETGTWENGLKIKFTERKETTSYLMNFYKDLGLHRTFFKRNRIENAQTDPSRLGSLLPSDERIVRFVSENKGAIGVVSESALEGISVDLKIIEIDEIKKRSKDVAEK